MNTGKEIEGISKRRKSAFTMHLTEITPLYLYANDPQILVSIIKMKIIIQYLLYIYKVHYEMYVYKNLC